MSKETLPKKDHMPEIDLDVITACMNAEPPGKSPDRLNAARLQKIGRGDRENILHNATLAVAHAPQRPWRQG